jgi:formylmethanofuran dehydrogenase subunit E
MKKIKKRRTVRCRECGHTMQVSRHTDKRVKRSLCELCIYGPQKYLDISHASKLARRGY